jgi:hypothetical protein
LKPGKITGDEMNETQRQLQRAPDVHTYHYPPPVPCAGCGGAGRVALLVTGRPCGTCEGSGKVWPEPRDEYTPASRETRNTKLEIRNKFQARKEEMEGQKGMPKASAGRQGEDGKREDVEQIVAVKIEG